MNYNLSGAPMYIKRMSYLIIVVSMGMHTLYSTDVTFPTGTSAEDFVGHNQNETLGDIKREFDKEHEEILEKIIAYCDALEDGPEYSVSTKIQGVREGVARHLCFPQVQGKHDPTIFSELYDLIISELKAFNIDPKSINVKFGSSEELTSNIIAQVLGKIYIMKDDSWKLSIPELCINKEHFKQEEWMEDKELYCAHILHEIAHLINADPYESGAISMYLQHHIGEDDKSICNELKLFREKRADVAAGLHDYERAQLIEQVTFDQCAKYPRMDKWQPLNEYHPSPCSSYKIVRQIRQAWDRKLIQNKEIEKLIERFEENFS